MFQKSRPTFKDLSLMMKPIQVLEDDNPPGQHQQKTCEDSFMTKSKRLKKSQTQVIKGKRCLKSQSKRKFAGNNPKPDRGPKSNSPSNLVNPRLIRWQDVEKVKT